MSIIGTGFIENFKMAIDTLKTNKLRSFLTIFGVLVGVITLMLIGSILSGIDTALTKEIERIINSKIAVLKSQIYGHLKESLRKYFWETVDAEKKVFVPGRNDVSLGYLLLRRFASSLSKENIKKILGDKCMFLSLPP